MHEDKDGSLSLVYDLMEPLRPKVDRLVLELIASRTFKMNCDPRIREDMLYPAQGRDLPARYGTGQ
ncbi:MAG: CRISPR-associated endonuclease Cas1 [Armatimonadetes bacterium]|nr:CRISPR-associated endonuclease Cas1 [Armatimonadota bacterium]